VKKLFTSYPLVVILVSLVIVPGCRKELNACFTVEERDIYLVDDPFKLDNCSSGAKSYLWILPDGSTKTGANVKIIPRVPGHYIIDLIAYSRNKTEADTITETVLVQY